MSLDQRLERAREDYRALEPTDGTTIRLTPPARRRGPRPGLVAAAAVAVVALAIAGVVAARDDEQGQVATEPTEDPSTTEPTDGPASSSPEPTASSSPATPPAAEETSGDLVLAPGGPYADGQEVAIRPGDGAPAGAVTLVELCVDTDGTCEPIRSPLPVRPGDDPAAQVARLARVVATDATLADCADEAVTCRLRATLDDEATLSSDRIAFDAAAPPAGAAMTAEPAGPGSFAVELTGVEADPTWLAAHDVDPEAIAVVPPFALRACSVGASGVVEIPFAEPNPAVEVDGPGAVSAPVIGGDQIDPDDPNGSLTVAVPNPIIGYGQWAACDEVQCYLELAARTDVRTEAGGVSSSEQVVARALLPLEAPWPVPAPPTLTIDTPGPHQPDQVVSITIEGLPEGYEAAVRTCRHSWSEEGMNGPGMCDYEDDGLSLTNGTQQVTLMGGVVEKCHPEDCWLELEAGVEMDRGVVATAPLDTPG